MSLLFKSESLANFAAACLLSSARRLSTLTCIFLGSPKSNRRIDRNMDPPAPSWRRLSFVEPVPFFILFSFALSDSVITDAIVYKKCVQIMAENKSECAILYENSSSDAAKSLQESIQPQVATVFVLKTSIETLFPTLLILFLGPWSDANGRKPLLTFPFIGSIVYYSGYSILSRFDLEPYWFLAPSTASALMGGFPAILLTCFCYVADVTDSRSRAWRLGFLDFVLFGGQLVGLLASPAVFRTFGYCTVFACSAASCLLGLLYSHFLLRETIYSGTGRSLRSIFDLTLIRDVFKTVTRKRSGFDRCLIWCCLVIIALHDDMMQGTATILYLYSKRFGWSILDFSTYSVVQLVITMFGMMLLIKVIAPLLRIPESYTIMIASLSNCGNSLTKAFARQAWHVYLSAAIGIFSLAPASLVRSIISKTVSQQDIGKAFAVTSTMEKIGPFVTTPLFVLLHTNFIKMYPCPVWFLPAGLCVIIVILAFVVERRWKLLKRNHSLYESNA